MSNEFGYGIHSLRTGPCPNCGSATDWYSFHTGGFGVNASRCYTCAPVWSEALGLIGFFVLIAGLAVFCVTVIAGELWPLGISAAGAVLLAIANWPRWRNR